MAFFGQLSEAPGPGGSRKPRRSRGICPGPPGEPGGLRLCARRRAAKGTLHPKAAPLQGQDGSANPRLQGLQSSIFKEFPATWPGAVLAGEWPSRKAALAFQPLSSTSTGRSLAFRPGARPPSPERAGGGGRLRRGDEGVGEGGGRRVRKSARAAAPSRVRRPGCRRASPPLPPRCGRSGKRRDRRSRRCRSDRRPRRRADGGSGGGSFATKRRERRRRARW